MSTDLHDLTGAYAAGALPTPERLAIQEHLDGCPRCAQEARELLETAALLGLAASAPPPSRLRTRVLAEAAATAQLPPLLSTRRAAHTCTGRTTRTAGRWPLRAAACLAALAVAFSTYNAMPGTTTAPADQVQALQPSATVTADPQNTQLTFNARGLRQPGPARAYQLWLLDAAGPRPAATFTPTRDGRAQVVIDRPGDPSAVLVSEEPAGGSPAPTSEPILTLDLPQT